MLAPTTDAFPEVYFSRLFRISCFTFAIFLKQDNGILEIGLSSIKSKRADPNARPQSSNISEVNAGEAH